MADKGRPVQRHPNLLLDNDRRDISLASNSISGAVSGQIAAHVAKTDPHTQYLLVDGTRAMSGNLDFAGNEAIDIVVHNVDDDTDKSSLTPIEGKLAYQLDTKGIYLCTSAE